MHSDVSLEDNSLVCIVVSESGKGRLYPRLSSKTLQGKHENTGHGFLTTLEIVRSSPLNPSTIPKDFSSL